MAAALEAHGTEDEKNLATAPNSATDSIGAPSSSSESSKTLDSIIATTNPSHQNEAGSSDDERAFLSADDERSLEQQQPAPAPSLLPSSSATDDKLDLIAFELDNNLDDLLPFPIPLIKYFPMRLPEFHDDGTRQWLPEQKQPSCGDTFYLFCCVQGPPISGVGRASPRTKDDTDLPKRRRQCKRCKFPPKECLLTKLFFFFFFLFEKKNSYKLIIGQ